MAANNSTEIWIEERIFIFDCLLQFLRASIADEEDPLTILTMTILLHNLGERNALTHAVSKLEGILQNLPEIQDSGYQRRDCLLASGCAYIAKRIQLDKHYFRDALLPRIDFAAARNWFDDPRLATLVALLPEDMQANPDARNYLKDNLNTWLSDNYIAGILPYCLVEEQAIESQLVSYLKERDWSKDSVEILSWGLLALGKLQARGEDVHQVQYMVAKYILETLRNSELVQAILKQEQESRFDDISSITSFQVAFALYALNKEGFDRIVGLRWSQHSILDELLTVKEKLIEGGKVVSRRQLLMLNLAFFAFLLFSLNELLQNVGFPILLETSVGIIAQSILTFILAVIMTWLFNRGVTSFGATKEIVGNVTSNDDKG